jgi:heparosan-N-sulfate-glucuronate 5-epimerase
LSSANGLLLPLGLASDPTSVRGYPIDFRVKAESPKWTPPDGTPPGNEFVYVAQFGLGAYERWVMGEGEQWLQTAIEIARYLVAQQRTDGSWLNRADFEHTFPVKAPWRSGMAQGEGASLLVRVHTETGDATYADAARRALAPLGRAREDEGTLAWIDGRPWPEEYPTRRPSYVLNGAIFAWWGMRDVGVGLGDADATAAFETGVDTLAATLPRFDTGSWSVYSLYPHPVKNVASPFYHTLHITQLEATQRLAPRSEIEEIRRRWVAYRESPMLRRRAIAEKVLFRLVVPRNRLLGNRLPWLRD